MKRTRSIFAATVIAGAVVFTSACGSSEQPQTSQTEASQTEASQTEAPTQDSSSSSTEGAPGSSNSEESNVKADYASFPKTSSGEPLKFSGNVITVPEGWTKGPRSAAGKKWQGVYDSSASSPKGRIKLTHAYNSHSQPDIAIAELVTTGDVEGVYGDKFKVVGNDNNAKIKGSDKAIITDFNYEADNGESMRGRWIAFRDPARNSVAVVEITGFTSFLTDDLVKTITDSIEVQH